MSINRHSAQTIRAVSAIILFCFVLAGVAEEKLDLSTEAKIDSIYAMQKELSRNRQPLRNKKIGIEVNPVRLLFMNESIGFSGTVSFFAVNRHAELAFPIFYSSDTGSKGFSEFDIDCHYRYFLGNYQKGFYVSGFVRYAHLQGYQYTYGSHYPAYDYTYGDYASFSANRLGVGMGLGVRVFSRSGFYWGAGLIVGKYFDGGYDAYRPDITTITDFTLNTTPTILEFELLKIGWAF